MRTKLIIIRGNSGSGKTTIANGLQKLLNSSCLISQDVIRREMLNVRDTPNNIAIGLIKEIALYSRGKVNYIILEGILFSKIYKEMIASLLECFTDDYYAFYFDLPLEETLRRHEMKGDNSFGEIEIRRWWKPKDFLYIKNEIILNECITKEKIITYIYNTVQ